MSHTTVKLNGKTYEIACDEGQEERVRQLGAYVAERYGSIAAGGGGVSEMQNMVLTSIILADEIADLRDYVAALEQERGQMDPVEPRIEIREVVKEIIKEVPVPMDGMVSEEDVDQMADMVMKVTERINSLSNKLAKAA
ncbi:MAG: cell division protein ZapA [Rhodospirillales bacterium]|nr:cell division protein ZapA [Rhodospirillales bacterium]MCB9965531.1 cell division protein ZapA [Rhodospirillales bacterium]